MFCEIYKNIKDKKINVRVDANGGWNVNQSIEMINWLSKRE